MKHRLALWATAGVVVASAWVLISLTIHLSFHPMLWMLARLTCPIALLLPHTAIKWYWVVLSNVPIYLLLGGIVEGIRMSGSRLRAAA